MKKANFKNSFRKVDWKKKKATAKTAVNKYNDQRNADIEKRIEPIRDALRGSAFAYTTMCARDFAAFVENPSAENYLALNASLLRHQEADKQIKDYVLYE